MEKNKTFEYCKECVLSCLNKGQENAVTQDYIKALTGISRRHIRLIIHELRQEGHPICSTSYDGYWLAANEEEIDYCLMHIKAQINTLNTTVIALRKAKKNL